ncbi:MAG: CHAP domain-containing protein [Thermoguttaceae bacterium]
MRGFLWKFVAISCLLTAALVRLGNGADAPAGASGGKSAKVHARSSEEVWTALVALLEKIRAAAESHGIKKVVVLTSLDRKLSDTRAPAFLQEALLTAWYGGPHVAQPPATVRSVPTKITPAALSKLRWPDHKTPTVLAVTSARRPDKTEINLTLLDAKEVFWHGTFALTAAEVAAIPAVPPVNQRILRFATDQRGQQVGDGECWTLADQALKAAGAQHPGAYVWGRPLAAGERVFPGDIVQFSSVRLTHGSAWTTLGAPNHTAIIEHVKAPHVYVLIHQNFDGKVVKETTVDLSTKTAGTFIIYRPVPEKAPEP